MEKNKELFEKMPVGKALANLALPTVVSQLIMMIYNLADTFFIGRSNNPYMIAAASLSYVLFFMLTAIGSLFGVGGGSLVSRLLGESKSGEARKVSACSFYLSILVTALYCLGVLVFLKPLLRQMGASDNTMEYSCQYTMLTVVIGGIPATLSLVMSHLLRCVGKSRISGFGLSVGGILNCFLDPVFMFVLLPDGMEVLGAAAATALCNILVMIFFAIVLIQNQEESPLGFSFQAMKEGLPYTGKIVSVGLSSALSLVLMNISIMITNHLASLYGDIPVAAIGIVKKLEMLPNNIGTGLCQGMIPLVAYNYSAGNRVRMEKAMNLTRCWVLGIAFFSVLLFFAFPLPAARLFIQEEETVSTTAHFLKIMILAIPFAVVNFHMCYALQAMGKAKESLILAVCRQGVFQIPALYLMNVVLGLGGLIATQILADGLTLIVSFSLYHHVKKNMR